MMVAQSSDAPAVSNGDEIRTQVFLKLCEKLAERAQRDEWPEPVLVAAVRYAWTLLFYDENDPQALVTARGELRICESKVFRRKSPYIHKVVNMRFAKLCYKMGEQLRQVQLPGYFESWFQALYMRAERQYQDYIGAA